MVGGDEVRRKMGCEIQERDVLSLPCMLSLLPGLLCCVPIALLHTGLQ